MVRRATEKNEMTGETSEALSRAEIDVPGKVTSLVLDPQQHKPLRRHRRWRPALVAARRRPAGSAQGGQRRSPVTALNLLQGGKSLAVGQENGALSVWFAVRQTDVSQRLERIHEFPRQIGRPCG